MKNKIAGRSGANVRKVDCCVFFILLFFVCHILCFVVRKSRTLVGLVMVLGNLLGKVDKNLYAGWKNLCGSGKLIDFEKTT